jgi:hypothetical protein
MAITLSAHNNQAHKTNWQKINLLATTTMLLLFSSTGFSQCADSLNIYSFVYNGHTYEVVRENETWIDASSCAVNRGGYLAEINDVAEQNEIFTQLTTNAGITISNTENQFGTASVWIGGSDSGVEGEWLWDGDNDGTGPQFWSGGPSGTPVGGLYSNWGVSPAEPDNSGGQDHLCFIIKPTATNFGLWNDLLFTNSLYYVIESNSIAEIAETELQMKIKVYPNPVNDVINVDNSNDVAIEQMEIYDLAGKKIISAKTNEVHENRIDVTLLNRGTYLLKIYFENGSEITQTIVK